VDSSSINLKEKPDLQMKQIGFFVLQRLEMNLACKGAQILLGAYCGALAG
jgi:hypothetical protein